MIPLTAGPLLERFNNFQIHGRTIQVREDKLGHLAFLNNTPHQYHHRSPNLEATPDSPDHRARTPNSAPRIPSASGMGYLPGHGMFPAQPVSFMRFPGALAMSPFMIPPDSPPYPDEPPEDDDELASPTMETVNAAIGSLSLGSQASSLPRDRPHLQPAADGPWQPYPPELSSALRLNSPVEPPPFQRRPSTGGRFRRPPPLSGNYMYSTAFSPPPMSPLSYPVGPFHFNPLSPIYTGPLDRRLSGGFLPSDFPIGPQGEFGVYYGTPGPAAAAGPPGLPGLVGRGPEEVPAAARNEAAVVEAEEKAVVEKEEAAESTQGTAGTEPLEKLMGGS